MNHIFRKILNNRDGDPSVEIENIKFFKTKGSDEKFSLLDVLKRENNVLYEMLYTVNNFKYVGLKIRKIKEKLR